MSSTINPEFVTDDASRTKATLKLFSGRKLKSLHDEKEPKFKGTGFFTIAYA